MPKKKKQVKTPPSRQLQSRTKTRLGRSSKKMQAKKAWRRRPAT